jgi:hypothetical protein
VNVNVIARIRARARLAKARKQPIVWHLEWLRRSYPRILTGYASYLRSSTCPGRSPRCFFVVLESALEILPVYLFLCSRWPFVAENIHQPIDIHPDRLDVFRTQWLLVLAGDQTASKM